MSAKTERIVILGTPDFKAFLMSEAHKEGVSLSQLVRQRCERKAKDQDEEILLSLVREVKSATSKAKKALDAGLSEANRTLTELRAAK